uniref:Zinc finger protein 638-like n=1 Tax=Sphaeramia orbicularis TaxID=375764 RepID=A0A672Y8G9_9TELE
MYHHQGPQPFSNGPRPPPNQQQTRPPSDMLSQVMGFQFPRPTQLPDELESALSIRGSRDMDHRLIEHIDRPNQHQNQGGSGISQHGSYSSNLPDNQPSQQPGVDWTNYQPPSKLFANAPPSAGHQPHHGQQQPGTSLSAWNAPISDSPSPQTRHSHSGGGDGQGLYTPESAGSILASFGLSNEDLEVLSHYPDDQLTPDTLPFILRDIQINKSGKPKSAPATSSSSFSRSISDMQLPPSHSSPLARSNTPEVPSLLTVTQTAGKVIDYGHASRAKDDSSTRETFKREPLSTERTVKLYPSSSSAPKVETGERRQVRLEPTESSKHGDRDYRRTSSEHQRSSRSPAREFSKSRHQDRDYRHERLKPRPVSETRSEESSLSRRPVSKPHSSSSSSSSSKKLPTPTMRSDFSAMSPKVYPHTCSICEVQCDQEKDWIAHINTVNHTAACRDLRNKYPDWKPNIASRSGRYGSRAANLQSHSPSRSSSWSRSPSPNKHKLGHDHRPHGRTFTPHHYPRHHYTDFDHRFERQHSGSRSPSHSYRTSSRDDERESSGGSSRSGLKRPHYDLTRRSTHINPPPSSTKRARLVPGQVSKTLKTGAKGVIKTAKTAAGKDNDSSGKTQLVKKKKKVVPPVPKAESFVPRLVYLTGIPKDATEQEVTDLVGSFGKINNVILLPCSEEENEKEEGQKASVCMIKAEDAQALAQAPNLTIKDQVVTASIAKTPEPEKSSYANDSKSGSDVEKGPAEEDTGSGDTEQKTSDETGLVMITGLPQDGWSEDDIIRLAEPFGTPSDLVISRQNGKALVYMSDMETAEEMVKVHTFMPPKMKECDLNVMHIKQRISRKTPVALYNLLMGSLDPLESLEPVGWKSLIVIGNVPPSSSSEVQKLVRRFGTVIKTLVLNDMVICEMATAEMALSVCKRFQRFPCIIQNNPLFFSRKPDPKAQAKVITTFLNSAKDTPANGKDEETTTAPVKEECEAKEISEPLQEQEEKDDHEEVKAAEEVKAGEDEVEVKKEGDEIDEQPQDTVVKKEEDAEMKETQEPTVETEIQLSESVSPKENGGAETLTTDETKPNSSDGEATSVEPVIPELPKVTQEMVKALIVECRTRTATQANRTAAEAAVTADGEQQETQTETADTDEREKSTEKTKEAVKNYREEETKRQEDRKEREGRRERERRDREKEEKARKEREREERVRRERREEGRREWERKERQRRGRKRAYEDGSSGSRWRHDSPRGRDERWKDDKNKVQEEEEEEQFDDFPFNMNDFVTVDEVGDVNDLPCPPCPTVPMETTGEEEEDNAPQSVQEDATEVKMEDTPMEVATETTKSDNALSESEGQSSEGKVETSDSLVSSDLPPDSEPPPSQTPAPSHQQDATDTETDAETPVTTVDSKPEVKPPSVSAVPPNIPAESPTNSTATGVSITESEEEPVVPEKAEDKPEEAKEDEDTEMTAAAAEMTMEEKDEKSEGSTDTGPKKTEAAISKDSLPPFNPSNPVGMEFLVPKTGFLCKVCNRFFCGNKQVEMNHCKTLKHYENLQKFLQRTNS